MVAVEVDRHFAQQVGGRRGVQLLRGHGSTGGVADGELGGSSPSCGRDAPHLLGDVDERQVTVVLEVVSTSVVGLSLPWRRKCRVKTRLCNTECRTQEA